VLKSFGKALLTPVPVMFAILMGMKHALFLSCKTFMLLGGFCVGFFQDIQPSTKGLFLVSFTQAEARDQRFRVLAERDYSSRAKKGRLAPHPYWTGTYPDVRYRRPFMHPQRFVMTPKNEYRSLSYDRARQFYYGTLAPRHIPSFRYKYD
jgi:hypothetical protein